MPIMLAAAALLSGCYYDPATGSTYAYPPAYGYPPPAPAPGYGAAPAPEYGAAPVPEYGAAPAPGYGEAAPQAYAVPPPPPPQGYGGAPAGAYGAGYVGAPAPAGWITRDQFIQRAMQRATAANRDPQRAAQRAAAVFDQIDVNHSGVVTQAQLRAWRQAHPRPAGGSPPPAEYQ